MIDDHCIVTKYELSTKEKQLKKAFFKGENSSVLKNPSDETKINLHNTSLKSNPQMEEMLSKALIEESNKKKQTNYNNTTSQSNMMPLNLIYTQNKILERNVDIVQETQKSIHDLLVYNIKSANNTASSNSSNNKMKDELLAENKKLLQEFIAPLYKNISSLKGSVEHLLNENNNNPNSEINNKVHNLLEKHNEFKEMSNNNSRKPNNNLTEKSKNIQNLTKDTQIFKAIDEIKGSVKNISDEMGKMECEFNDNMKRVIENQERRNLMNIINGGGSKTEAKRNIGNTTNINGPLPQFEKKNTLEEFSYQDLKNEMVDILDERDKLFNNFMSSKLEIPKTKPSDKINFSYKIDSDDNQDFNRSNTKKKGNNQQVINNQVKNHSKQNKRMNSQKLSLNHKELSNLYPKKEKNVFLDNLMSYSTEEKEKQKAVPRNVVIEESKSSPINYLSGTGSGGVLADSTKSRDVIDYGINKINSSMKSNLSNFNLKDSSTSKPFVNQINVHENTLSTKNTVNSTPTTSKNLVSFNKLQVVNKSLNTANQGSKESKEIKLSVIEEDHLPSTREICDNPVNKTLLLAQSEAKKINSFADRRGITEVDVTTKQKERTNVLHDVVLKLCIEKMMNDKNKNKPIVLNENILFKNEKIEQTEKPLYPFKYHEIQLYSISENLIRDKIALLLKSKNKTNVNEKLDSRLPQDNKVKLTLSENPISFEINKKSNENIEKDKIYNENYIKLQEEISKRDDELESKLKQLYNKLETIDDKINSQKIENREIESTMPKNQVSNINMEDIINKISSQIKDNMHININLQQPEVSVKPNQPEIIIKKAPSLIQENFDLILEKNFNKKQDSPSKQSIASEYSHPFARSINKNNNYNDFEIANPYYYNLEEYEVSSESLVTSSKRQDTDKSGLNQYQISGTNQNSSYITEQTLSDGQLPNTKRSVNKDLVNKESNSQSQNIQTEESSSENEERKKHSSIVMNLLHNLNPKNEAQMNTLKKLNLYDSEEHSKFQGNYLKRMQDINQIENNNSQRNNYLYASFGNNAFTNYINSPQINMESNRSSNTVTYKLPKLTPNTELEIMLKKSEEKHNNIHTITEGESESNLTNNDQSLLSSSLKNK